jgi:hypothetical protein
VEIVAIVAIVVIGSGENAAEMQREGGRNYGIVELRIYGEIVFCGCSGG